MVERLGEMRKGRRERLRKGAERGLRKGAERIEKRKRQFEKEGLRDPSFLEFSRSDPAMQPLFLQVLRV